MLEELGVSWAHFFFWKNEILRGGEWGPTWGVISILPCGFLRFLQVLHGYLASTTGPVTPPFVRQPIIQGNVWIASGCWVHDSFLFHRGDMDSAFRGGFASRNIYVIHGFLALSTGSMESPNWQYSQLVSEVCIALGSIPRTRKKKL